MSDPTPQQQTDGGRINWSLFVISGGFIALFCARALIDMDQLSAMVDAGFTTSATYFGLYWQMLMLATFLIGLLLCVLPGGGSKLGGLEKPEFSLFQWGFLAWAILGSLSAVMLMHYHYDKGLPLAPRTLLYPVFGDKAI